MSENREFLIRQTFLQGSYTLLNCHVWNMTPCRLLCIPHALGKKSTKFKLTHYPQTGTPHPYRTSHRSECRSAAVPSRSNHRPCAKMTRSGRSASSRRAPSAAERSRSLIKARK